MDMNELFGDYQNGNYNIDKKTMGGNNFENNTEKNNNSKEKKPKKKGGILSVLIVFILIIGLAGGAFATYMYTDIFKTPKQLMAKYALNLYDNMLNITPIANQIANKNTGRIETNGKLKILPLESEEVDETAFQMLENLALNVNLKADFENKGLEFIVGTNLLGQEMDIRLVRNQDIYAIGSSLVDISSEYDGKTLVGIENNNLKDFAQKFNAPEEVLEYIPTKINFDALDELFTEEELNDIKLRYFAIVNEKLTDEIFTVENNVPIVIESAEYETKRITATLTSKDLIDILVNAFEELRNDKVILDSYKKIVDIEVPEDVLNEAFDSMSEELVTIQTEEETEVSGNMIFNLYVYEGAAIQLEILVTDNKNVNMQEVRYSVLQIENGYSYITETYEPGSSAVANVTTDIVYNEPGLTQKTIMNIEITDNGERIVGVIETKYDEVEDTNSDYYQSSFYEDSSYTYTYEITDFSASGYKDSFSVTIDPLMEISYEGTTKFDQEIDITKLTDENTVKLNDLTAEEMTTLLNTIMIKITGEGIDEPSDIVTDNTTIPELPDYTDVPVTSEDPSSGDVTIPVEEVATTFETLTTELDAAITTCEQEALNNEEYLVRDFVNEENLKILCPTISSISTVELLDTSAEFTILTIDGKEFSYKLEFNGDSCVSKLLIEKYY